jgi:hypothetical protein
VDRRARAIEQLRNLVHSRPCFHRAQISDFCASENRAAAVRSRTQPLPAMFELRQWEIAREYGEQGRERQRPRSIGQARPALAPQVASR